MVCSMSVKTRDAQSQKINNANIFRPDNGHVHVTLFFSFLNLIGAIANLKNAHYSLFDI